MAVISPGRPLDFSGEGPQPKGKPGRWRRLALWIAACLAIMIAAGVGALWAMQPDEVAPAAPVQPSGPTIPIERIIEAGPVRGIVDNDIMIFKGIPYAAPPVGVLRWQAPAPVRPWEGSLDATQFADDCMQNKAIWDPARSTQPMSEDCLGINIWAPTQAPADGAPVVFWIHGGGFVQGSSSQPALDGSEFARRGVILVSFNYRLGRFGFFAHPALDSGNPNQPTGNWGLMDQFAALSWVKTNIAAFGGDPARVTLVGQSAGGASVAQLMLDPQARGLFSGAVIQSSGGRNRWPLLSDPDPERRSGYKAGIAFAVDQGLTEPGPEDLRALPADAVLGDISMTKLQSETYSGPMIDGRLVRQNFVDGFVAGLEAQVPLIVGYTDRELSHLPFLARYALRRWAKNELAGSLDQVRSSYDSTDAFNDNIVNDWGFVEPARTMAKSHSDRGAPTWLYEFAYVSENRRDEFDGAPHASDVTFTFNTLGHEGVPPTRADRQLASLFQSYWLGFARTGTPEVHAAPGWMRYRSGDDRMMRFNRAGAAIEPVQRPRSLDAITRAMIARQRQ